MNRCFSNPWAHEPHRLRDVLLWKSGWAHREQPLHPDAVGPAEWIRLERDAVATVPPDGWRVVWLGHATFLLQGAGVSLLIDPIFSSHCAPLRISSLRRLVPPPCAIADLPAIDAVLITHTHYDHADLKTLVEIGRHVPVFVPEGHARWLIRQGFRQVTELRWHETAECAPGVRLTATPAQHFTSRTWYDRNRGHWCGWLVQGAGASLWHAGDSGYCAAFREIGATHGPIDFGMIPIGAYQPRALMKSMHMNPEEALRAFIDTRCRRAVGMHWGTFRLTDEPLGEPARRLSIAVRATGISDDRFAVTKIGAIHRIFPEEVT